MPSYTSVSGMLIPSDQAVIPVQDRGFRYGDGVFETIAVYDGTPYQWELHMKRLEAGLCALTIPCDTSEIRHNALDLLQQNELRDATIRIAISRGIGSIGYRPTTHGGSATVVIEACERDVPPLDPATLYLSSYEKVSAKALPVQFKLAQGLNSTLVRIEAAEHGCLDGLQLNTHGFICETSSANIFWRVGKTLYTPELSCGLLDGTTRAAILRCSPYAVEQGRYELSALQAADAVVITNSNWQVAAITALKPNGWKWEESMALASQLRDALQKDIADYVARAKA